MARNKTYEAWRESQVAKVGGKVQRAGEAYLQKHQEQELVLVNDERTGERRLMKADVAAVLESSGRRAVSRPKSYFFMSG